MLLTMDSDTLAKTDGLTTYLVEDRNGVVSPYGRGNSKLGEGIYTYSRLPGKMGGTCPGATAYCESVCYAKRVVDNVPVWDLWRQNSHQGPVPMPPKDAAVVRWHVSGDFDTVKYIEDWIRITMIRRDVQFFGYTRSWRVPELLKVITELRDQPNVQLFASLDRAEATEESPIVAPKDEAWRWSMIVDYVDEEEPLSGKAFDGRLYLVCPEETGRKKNCMDCGFCFRGQRGDVIFIEH